MPASSALMPAPFARAPAVPPLPVATVEAKLLISLQRSVAEQGERLADDMVQLKQGLVGFVSKEDFSTWNTAMNQQVADFLQQGLAEITRDLQLQLSGIRNDILALAASATSHPPAGVGEAPNGDPEVELLVCKGTKRKAAASP